MKTTLLLLASLCVFAGHAAAAAEARKPSIIFILADDFGWGDTGCYGHPYAKTPNIDSLARDGTRFTQCYSTGVTCCPGRTGFMTAKFPATYAKYPANAGFRDRITITELLKKQGYATAHFGKWHIGPDAKPGTYGIDVIGADEGEPCGKRRQSKAERGRDAHIYDNAFSFIKRHKDTPFYINIWDHIAHHPVNPSQAALDAFGPLQVDESKFPPQMQEKFANCKKLGGDVSTHMRAYLADVKSMDHDIGMLLKLLDELGLRENTIIAFSSDQGPAHIRDSEDSEEPSEKAKAKKERKRENKGKPAPEDAPADPNAPNIRLNQMGSAGPFRGGKHNQYEGGVRIPFIVRWPGRIPSGRVDETSVISGADWLPTLCSLTGTPINAVDFDGLDAGAAWLGKDFTRYNPLFWKAGGNAPTSIRDGQWKLHHPNNKRGELELYDIATDPAESSNLALQHPAIVKQLTTKIEAWHATLPKDADQLKGDDDK